MKSLDLNYFYYNQIINLYTSFTSFNKENFTLKSFKTLVKKLPDNHHVLFMLNDRDEIIAGITLIIEQKIIHNGGKVGHIEDFVVLEEYRKKGIGVELFNYVKNICEVNNCYKIILDCDPILETFYEKKGFTKKGSYMAYYY